MTRSCAVRSVFNKDLARPLGGVGAKDTYLVQALREADYNTDVGAKASIASRLRHARNVATGLRSTSPREDPAQQGGRAGTSVELGPGSYGVPWNPHHRVPTCVSVFAGARSATRVCGASAAMIMLRDAPIPGTTCRRAPASRLRRTRRRTWEARGAQRGMRRSECGTAAARAGFARAQDVTVTVTLGAACNRWTEKGLASPRTARPPLHNTHAVDVCYYAPLPARTHIGAALPFSKLARGVSPRVMLSGRTNYRKVDEPVGAPGDIVPVVTAGGKAADVGVRDPSRPSAVLASRVERARVAPALTRDIDYVVETRTLEQRVAGTAHGAFSTTVRPL